MKANELNFHTQKWIQDFMKGDEGAVTGAAVVGAPPSPASSHFTQAPPCTTMCGPHYGTSSWGLLSPQNR